MKDYEIWQELAINSVFVKMRYNTRLKETKKESAKKKSAEKQQVIRSTGREKHTFGKRREWEENNYESDTKDS